MRLALDGRRTLGGRAVVTLAVAALIVGSLWGLLAGPAGSVRCLTVGASSNYQYSVGQQNTAHDLAALRHAGITTLREDVLWQIVQPSSPDQWNWTAYDRLFAEAARYGMRVLPIVDYGTTWASAPGGVLDMPTSPTGQAAYARFAAAVVVRYGPSGTFWTTHPSVRPLPVTGVELWNEPWFRAGAQPATYIALLRAAGAAVHRVSRDVQVAANADDRNVHGSSASSPLWGPAKY